MKSIQDIADITLTVREDELLEGKWINYEYLSKKIGVIEESQNKAYRSLRTRLYNSYASHKYNTTKIAGLIWIDVTNPMRNNVASLKLVFKKGNVNEVA